MPEATIKVYNRGLRVFNTKHGDLHPQRAISVPEAEGFALIKGYPKELIQWGEVRGEGPVNTPEEPKAKAKK